MIRTAPIIRVEAADPGDEAARALLDALSRTLEALTGASGRASFDPDDVRGAGACFLLAHGPEGEALGCGGYRPLEPGVAEIKRMYAVPGSRGVGAALLVALERRARSDGYETVRLETRRVNSRAVAFYERSGYVRIAAYGRYIGRSDAACFGKSLQDG